MQQNSEPVSNPEMRTSDAAAWDRLTAPTVKKSNEAMTAERTEEMPVDDSLSNLHTGDVTEGAGQEVVENQDFIPVSSDATHDVPHLSVEGETVEAVESADFVSGVETLVQSDLGTVGDVSMPIDDLTLDESSALNQEAVATQGIIDEPFGAAVFSPVGELQEEQPLGVSGVADIETDGSTGGGTTDPTDGGTGGGTTDPTDGGTGGGTTDPTGGDTVTLNVRLAGEAYRGNPRYEIVVDGEVVAQGEVDWSRETTTDGVYDLGGVDGGRGQIEWRDISVDLDMPEGGFSQVEVRFPNDAYTRDVGDRNLLVDEIRIGDHVIEAESEFVEYVGGRYPDGTTSERMPWKGTLKFDVQASLDAASDAAAQLITPPTVEVTAGFEARYFDVDERIVQLSDIDWNTQPTHTEVIDSINYQDGADSFWEGGSTDTFGAQIFGQIVVPENGNFTFHMGADDGAILIIDGEVIIGADQLQDYAVHTAEIGLDAGPHAIEVRYFENYGHAGLQLEWEGPGLDGRSLVRIPDGEVLYSVEGVPISLDVAVDFHGHDGTLALSGLPTGATVQAGDQVVTVTDQPVDLTGWDLSQLSVTPPIGFEGDISASLVATDEAGTPHVFDVAINVSGTPVPDLSTGMVGAFDLAVYMGQSGFENVDWESNPVYSDMVRTLDFDGADAGFSAQQMQAGFGIQINGEVAVEQDGLYQFQMDVDEAARMFVNGVPLSADDNGVFQATLGQGYHDITVQYFESGGDSSFKLEMRGPDADSFEPVVASDHLATAPNDPLSVTIETDAGTASVDTLFLKGLPADTRLVSGDNMVVTDGGPVDVSDWDSGNIEITPPAGFTGVINGEIEAAFEIFNGTQHSATSTFTIEVAEELNTMDTTEDLGELSVDHSAWVDVEASTDLVYDVSMDETSLSPDESDISADNMVYSADL